MSARRRNALEGLGVDCERIACVDVSGADCRPRSLPGPCRPGVAVTADGSFGSAIEPAVGEVDAEHRQAEQRGLEQGLGVDAAQARRVLRGTPAWHRRSASPDRDRPAADAQLVGEARVDLLAVHDEVGVAVLVAGAGDERRALAGERLGPVELVRRRRRVRVDDVVAGVAAGAEHDRVGEVRASSAVSSVVVTVVVKSAARALVALKWPARKTRSWRVVPSSLAFSCGRRPRGRIGARDVVRARSARPGDVAGPGREVVADGVRRVGRGSRSRSPASWSADTTPSVVAEIGVEDRRRLGGRLDEAADGEVRDRERVRVLGDRDVRPVGVLAEDVVQAEARLRSARC